MNTFTVDRQPIVDTKFAMIITPTREDARNLKSKACHACDSVKDFISYLPCLK